MAKKVTKKPADDGDTAVQEVEVPTRLAGSVGPTYPVLQHPMQTMLDYALVAKDGTNEHFRYKFASEQAVSSKIREGMKKANLHIASLEILDVVHSTYANARGVHQQYCTCRVRIFFDDSDGERYGPYEGIGAGSDAGDKAPMKAITSARKYAQAACCLLSWGDDPEADSSTDRHAAVEPPPPKLSKAAVEALESSKSVAALGMPALLEHWKTAIPMPVKRELSGREEWEDIKEVAEHASKRLQEDIENGRAGVSDEAGGDRGDDGDGGSSEAEGTGEGESEES
jgi:hypothetical protein